MLKQTPLFAMVLIVAALLSGCSSSPIDSTHWTLVEMGEHDQTSPLIDGTEIRLEFATIDGIVRGVAGCNTYSAPYRADSASLNIGEITATRMHCEPPEIMAQEARYLSALSRVTRFAIDDDTLTLTDGMIVLILERDWW